MIINQYHFLISHVNIRSNIQRLQYSKPLLTLIITYEIHGQVIQPR